MVKTGKAIPGQSTATGHQGWTAVDGISWKIEAQTSFLKGSGAAVGKPTLSAIGWSQALDTTVPSMYQNMVTGTPLDSATFDYVRSGSATGSPYFSLGLKTVFFAGLSMSTAGVSPKVVAKEFSLSYNPAPSDNASKPITATWDINKNTASAAPSLPPNAQLVGRGVAPGGAVQGYLRLGENIAGNGRASGYENWIPVNTAGWDIFAETSLLQGSGAAVGKATPGPLTWTQGLDATLLVSLAKITAGTRLPQVTLEFVKDAGAGPVTFMQLAMNDVYFTSLGVSGLQATESVVFKSVSETIWNVKTDGRRDDRGLVFNYDFAMQSSTGVAPAKAVTGFGLGNLSPRLALGFTEPAGVAVPGTIALVPEPQTWALMLGGGALLLGVARRRRAA